MASAGGYPSPAVGSTAGASEGVYVDGEARTVSELDEAQAIEVQLPGRPSLAESFALRMEACM